MNRISGEVMWCMILLVYFIIINIVLMTSLLSVSLLHKIATKNLFKQSVHKVGAYVFGLFIVFFSFAICCLFYLRIDEYIEYAVCFEGLIFCIFHLIYHKKKFYI